MSIPVIDTDEFRRRVAGLIDPNRRPTGAAETASIKEEATQLCLALCELYGDGLERMAMWDKISSALSAAAAKCDDGDTDRFAALCLETVQADHTRAACNESFAHWVLTMSTRDEAHRQAFVRHCGAKTAIVVVHARAAWQQRKQMKGGAA